MIGSSVYRSSIIKFIRNTQSRGYRTGLGNSKLEGDKVSIKTFTYLLSNNCYKTDFRLEKKDFITWNKSGPVLFYGHRVNKKP